VLRCGVFTVLAAGLSLGAGAARADDPAPAPVEGWKGKGELGLVDASGNTQTRTLDGKLDLIDNWGPWKEELNFSALKASSDGTSTAERYIGSSQTNYAINERSFLFGGLIYTDDKFSGFQYQANATVGYGYKWYDTKQIKLSTQIGVGYGKLKYEATPQDPSGQSKSSAVYTLGMNYENAITATTKIVDKFDYTGASTDTLIHNFIGVEVKMTTALALAVGFDVRHNSSPPAPKKTTDELSTVNLVFAF
jgi:putative salt-induced outer membrane protein